jgi:hypothetical protein
VTANEEQAKDGAPSPDRRARRVLLLSAVVVLALLGGLALAFSLYVGSQAEGFELTMTFGRRTTHVLGTNVTLTDADDERKCVLSLLDFRALREHAQQLLAVPPLEGKAARGAPSFTISEGATVNSGFLAADQLQPIDAFVIQHSSACIKTYVPTAPTPVQ